MCQQKNQSLMESLKVVPRRERSLSPCSVKSEPCTSMRVRSASSRRSSTPTMVRKRTTRHSPRSNKLEETIIIPDIKIEDVDDDRKSENESGPTILNGATMVQFYNLWNRKQRTKPLGRGKTELPNAFLRQDEYRQCGCKTRQHSAS